jgi:hypothetical protein
VQRDTDSLKIRRIQMTTIGRTKPKAANGAAQIVDPDPIDRPTGFFEQMITAVEEYPETYVDLEIVDVYFSGDVLNVGEAAAFNVKVTNRGPLHLTDVTLRISGQNGATVRNGNSPAPFVSDFVTVELPTINAHGGSQEYSAPLPYFKAPAQSQASKTLVKVTLEDWNLNLDHALIGHSDPHTNAPKGTYAAEVVAS